MHLDRKMIPTNLLGGYAGKKIQAEVCLKVDIPSYAGLWDGGSRTTYTAIRLSDGRPVPLSDNMSAPWDKSRQDKTIDLVPGLAVVGHSIFCGRDMGLTFYVHPENASTLLPVPIVNLTVEEQTVLNATCEFKASYNGRDRYQMALERNHWSGKPFMSRPDWETAKASLIAKKLLNKAGAVTVAGKNARTRD